LEIFSSKKSSTHTMEYLRNIYYPFCHIFFFLSSEGIVIWFRIVFRSILDFFSKKISNNAILFIYFRLAYRWIQKNNLFHKKKTQAI
jgi:hypothetical protein